MKDTAEARLQEKQLYCQLMSDCVSVSNSLSSAVLRNDCVFTQLKTEERLTNEIKEMLQKQICILLNKLRCDRQIQLFTCIFYFFALLLYLNSFTLHLSLRSNLFSLLQLSEGDPRSASGRFPGQG